MINSRINNSFSEYGSILYFVDNYDSSIQIENCVFSNNSGYFTLIDIGTSDLMITNTILENNTNNLFSVISANLVLIDSKINNHICFASFPGCILFIEETSLANIKSSSFENIISEIEEGNIYVDSSIVYLDSISMKGMQTPKKGSCFSSYSSSLYFVDSNFYNYEINCINSYQSNVILNNSIFDNSENLKNLQIIFDYGSFYCSSCNQISIYNTSFIKNLNVIDGSALYVVANENDKLNDVFIENSIFFGNNASGKGTIYIYNQNFSISSSYFQNNIVQRGGGIFCDNDGFIIKKKNLKVIYMFKVSIIMKMKIFNNIFIKNTAIIEGGAIKWNDEMPDLKNNSFLNNFAVYGENIACFPIRIILNLYNNSNSSLENIIYPNSDEILWPNDHETVSLINISSGNPIPYILQFQILDVYGKIVNLTEGYKFFLAIK